MKISAESRQMLATSDGDDAQLDYESLLNNEHPAFQFTSWAPQRAILNHPSCCVFLSHCGASSANEAIFHGVPILAMPNFGDQGPTALRAENAGVAIRINKLTFTPTLLSAAISRITSDVDQSFRRNVLRLQRIARVNSRRKYVAADMIEEVLYDHELRFEHSMHDDEWQANKNTQVFEGVGKELRPMHLQTADTRMSWLKVNNYDIYFTLGSLVLALVLGSKSLLSYIF